MSTFKRDFETDEEYRARLAAEAAYLDGDRDEAAQAKPVAETRPSPFIVEQGLHTSRKDREAAQAIEDRWTRLERLGR